MKILNFGSMNYDDVYELDHFLQPQETQNALSYARFVGGKGLNQSIALVKAGCEVYHAGCVGNDGGMLVSSLKKEGVNCDLIETIEEISGHAVIQLSKQENSILVYGGANFCVDIEMIDRVLLHFEKGDILLIQNEISALDTLILKAHQKGMRIILNPSPFNKDLTTYPLNLVDVFLLNEIEGRCLAGGTKSTSYQRIIKEIALRYPLAEIIMTVGEKGVYYYHKNVFLHENAYPVKVIDTTAAGDTFTGFYISSRLQNFSISNSLKIACRASSLAIQVKGASNSIPTWQKVLKQFQKYELCEEKIIK